MYSSTNIAERIKECAKNKGIPLNELLAKSGMGRNAISHLTNGSIPKADNLARIADCLDVSVDYLLGRTDNPMVATPIDANLRLVDKERQGGAASGDVIIDREKRIDIMDSEDVEKALDSIRDAEKLLDRLSDTPKMPNPLEEYERLIEHYNKHMNMVNGVASRLFAADDAAINLAREAMIIGGLVDTEKYLDVFQEKLLLTERLEEDFIKSVFSETIQTIDNFDTDLALDNFSQGLRPVFSKVYNDEAPAIKDVIAEIVDEKIKEHIDSLKTELSTEMSKGFSELKGLIAGTKPTGTEGGPD